MDNESSSVSCFRFILLIYFVFQCATFVGTVTYMSPERIRNENYSYPADIWSLGLALFECGTGEFPYTANEGPVNLMLQVNLLLLPFLPFCS
uniref:mitogen-activated protein kinase kinase n=1 Tax=Solanum tuberosum TaxID=4113 RepID=M1B852_SOLTU